MRLERFLLNAAAIIIACAVTAGGARAEGMRVEVSPFAGYRVGGELHGGLDDNGGGSSDTKDGGSWGVSVGLYRDPAAFYEFLYSRRNTGFARPGPELRRANVRIEYLHFGGTLLFPQPPGYTGYVSATVGITRLDGRSGEFDSERKFSASIGGGFRFPLAANLQATIGARGYLTFVDSDTGLVCVSGAGEARCLLQSSGSTFWEVEAVAGLNFRF